MRISVIMPCHNASAWIAEALRSVAAQTRPPFEVLLVDDDSTDDSVAAARRVMPGITVLPCAYRNAAAARNLAIDRASGDWVAMLDADDVWLPGHLEQAGKVLRDSHDVAYVAAHTFMDHAGQPVTTLPGYWHGFPDHRTGLTDVAYLDLMARNIHFGHSAVLYRLDRLAEVGGFDTTLVRRHDIDLWLRMIHGLTWAWGSQPGAVYRHDTPGSISRNRVEVAGYALRAIAGNARRYRHPTLDALTRSFACRAASVALHDAAEPWRSRLIADAWPHLPPAYRCFYTLAWRFPAPFRRAIAARRAWRRSRRRT